MLSPSTANPIWGSSVGFWGSGQPRAARKPLKEVGSEALTFLEGIPAARGRPDPGVLSKDPGAILKTPETQVWQTYVISTVKTVKRFRSHFGSRCLLRFWLAQVTAMVRHEWEDVGLSSKLWEDPADDEIVKQCGWGPAADLSDPEYTGKRGATTEFLSLLQWLFMISTISAEQTCLLAYFAHLGGMSDEVGRVGLGPQRPPGHYARHLRSVYGMKRCSQEHYTLNVPGHHKHDYSRTTHPMQVRPVHEAVESMFLKDPDVEAKLRAKVEEGDLPPSYFSNPVVKESPTPPRPLTLFIDALPYSLTDSVIAIWVTCLVTEMRALIALVRRRISCRCGCRGWCTFYPIMTYLKYCFQHLAKGIWPHARHDNLPWCEQDSHRASMAGRAMPMKAILLQFRGDWAEFCERLGVPTWHSLLRPCFLCSCSPEDLYKLLGITLESTPFHENTDDDYEQACARCEIRVEVTHALVPEINRLLHYDKRKDGALGRALQKDFPQCGLKMHDRLEPTASLPDVALFHKLCPKPGDKTTVLFWRRSHETLCLRRCPLWDPSIGLTPTRVIVLDVLHTLFLGVMNMFVCVAIWRMIKSGIWGKMQSTATEAMQVFVMTLRSNLMGWYRQYRRLHPEADLTEVADFTPGMLGTETKPHLKVKGAECYGLLLFIIEMYEVHKNTLGQDGERLLLAGKALESFVAIQRQHGYVMPAEARGELLNLLKNYAAYMAPFEHETPKLHLLAHLVLRIAWSGNPRLHACWSDEGANRILKKVLRNVSQLTFEETGLQKLSHVLPIGTASDQPVKRKRPSLK